MVVIAALLIAGAVGAAVCVAAVALVEAMATVPAPNKAPRYVCSMQKAVYRSRVQ